MNTAFSPTKLCTVSGSQVPSCWPQALKATARSTRVFTIFAQVGEVLDGAQVRVGAYVPGIGQVLRHRHAAREQQPPAHLPVAEIRERDDGVAADAQELLSTALGWRVAWMVRLRTA